MEHTLTAEAETADEVLFACRTCPRRIVAGKRQAKLVVIDAGDETAPHVGMLSGLADSAELGVPRIVP